jgi:polyhydroxyalkanoate synthesis regulator phasin
MRTRLLQVLIVLAVLGVTADKCGGAEKTIESPAGREAVETIGRLVAGKVKGLNEGQVAEGAQRFGQASRDVNPDLLRSARQASVEERNLVAEDLQGLAVNFNLTREEQIEALKAACNVYKTLDPQATEEQRAEAMAGFIPRDESPGSKFRSALQDLDTIAKDANESTQKRIDALLVCVGIELVPSNS